MVKVAGNGEIKAKTCSFCLFTIADQIDFERGLWKSNL